MSNLDLIDYYRNKIALVLLYCSITVSVFFLKNAFFEAFIKN